jgi:hypothetical protein
MLFDPPKLTQETAARQTESQAQAEVAAAR